MALTGLVSQVVTDSVTAALDGDVASGAGELLVDNADQFPATGAITVEDISTGTLVTEDYNYVIDDTEYPNVLTLFGVTSYAFTNGSIVILTDPYIPNTTVWVTTDESQPPIPATATQEMRVVHAIALAEGPRDPGTGAAVRVVEVGGTYRVDTVLAEPAVNGPNVIDLPIGPTAPPAGSPAAMLEDFGVGGIQVKWTPEPDATSYDVYASLTSGVTTSSVLVGQDIVDTQFKFDRIAGVRIPNDGVTLTYAAVVAKNDLGEAPIGAEGSAAALKADIEQLNVDQLNANTIEAMTAFFAALNVDVIFVGGQLIIGDPNASHIVLDPVAGLVFYGLDGVTVLGNFDITPMQQSSLSIAILTAAAATITDLQLRGTMGRLLNNAIMEMVATVPSPSTEPAITVGVGSRPWLALPTDYTEVGMFYDTASTNWYQLTYKASSAIAHVRVINAAGAQVGSTVTLDNHIPGSETSELPNGIVKVGTSLYALRRASGTTGSRNWYLTQCSATTGNYINSVLVGTEDTLSTGLASPYLSLGFDGTNLVVGNMSNDTELITGVSNRVGFARYNPSTLAFVDAFTQAGNIGSGLFARGCGIDSFSERGGTRFWIANTGVVFFFTFASGAITANPTYPVLTLESNANNIGFDGSNIITSVGAAAAKVYSRYVAPDDNARTQWVQYAWEAGADATLPSPMPATPALLPDGRYMTVTLPTDRASGTTTTRVFTGNGASAPANSAMYDRGTTTDPSMVLSSDVTSGTNPNTVSDFTSGTPGLWKSQVGGLLLDGSGHLAAPLKMQAQEHVAVPSGSGAVTVHVTWDTPFESPPAVSAPSMGGSSATEAAKLTVPKIINDDEFGCDVVLARSGSGTYWFSISAMLPET